MDFLAFSIYALVLVTSTCCSALEANDICFLELDPGPCKAKFFEWYFDKETQTCQEFIYGGCMGNANRFESAKDCLQKCGKGVYPDIFGRSSSIFGLEENHPVQNDIYSQGVVWPDAPSDMEHYEYDDSEEAELHALHSQIPSTAREDMIHISQLEHGSKNGSKPHKSLRMKAPKLVQPKVLQQDGDPDTPVPYNRSRIGKDNQHRPLVMKPQTHFSKGPKMFRSMKNYDHQDKMQNYGTQKPQSHFGKGPKMFGSMNNYDHQDKMQNYDTWKPQNHFGKGPKMFGSMNNYDHQDKIQNYGTQKPQSHFGKGPKMFGSMNNYDHQDKMQHHGTLKPQSHFGKGPKMFGSMNNYDHQDKMQNYGTQKPQSHFGKGPKMFGYMNNYNYQNKMHYGSQKLMINQDGQNHGQLTPQAQKHESGDYKKHYMGIMHHGKQYTDRPHKWHGGPQEETTTNIAHKNYFGPLGQIQYLPNGRDRSHFKTNNHSGKGLRARQALQQDNDNSTFYYDDWDIDPRRVASESDDDSYYKEFDIDIRGFPALEYDYGYDG